jgi:hypothetical protein
MISDLSNLDERQRSLYNAAAMGCINLVEKQGIPIKDAVQQTADMYKALVSDTENLKKVLFEEVTQEHSPCIVIKGSEERHRHWWTKYKDSSTNLSYWERYKTYLSENKHWSRIAIADLDDSTDQVMDLLANPQSGNEEERRGLVYGAVQSGKTAHYIGLINKAFSAGYRIFIVLTGMQNSLRSQTQSRIDEEVLGFETSRKMPGLKEIEENIIGVGKLGLGYEAKEKLQSFTNRDENGDINTKNTQGAYLPPYIIVTKKNSTPLNEIIKLIKNSQISVSKSKDGKNCIPAEYPALIIDDEADQASINTKKDENNATKINGLIRKMLNLFQCKSYVGYTATPFANIFIPHRAENDEYGKDLFPKDFIAKTPCPQQYIGAREFFGLGDDDSAEPMPLIRPIKEGADFLTQGTKKDDPVGELPKELETAIKYFMISTAVRNLRGQKNVPNTMLVHIVRFVEQQEKIKKKLSRMLGNIANLIKYNDSDIQQELKNIYEEDYVITSKQMKIKFSRYMDDCSLFSFDSVWNEIVRIISSGSEKIKVLAVNGKSEDSLIYQNHRGEPFNVIVIGGDKLSRGLTLEGLTISYFTRNAGAMDTLLQMGRWFGYRPGYIDVCRLFTTAELLNKFEIISYSAEDLSAQFDDMNTVGSNPEHFGLKVASNPNILISARNKIRTGADYQADFSASLTQTRLMDSDPETLEANYEAVDSLLSSLDKYRLDLDGSTRTYKNLLGRPKSVGKTFWIGVPSNSVIEFFKHYKTPRTALKASSKHIAEYIEAMNRCNGLTDWTVCLADIQGEKYSVIATQSAVPIEVHGITRNNRNQDAVVNRITRDLHVLTSAGDEELDLSNVERKKANEERKKIEASEKSKSVIARKVRAKVRKFTHGFLILYPILKVAEDIVTRDNKAPYAFAVVFPDRKEQGELKFYRLNEVAVEMEDE